jgi:hypothetical protein
MALKDRIMAMEMEAPEAAAYAFELPPGFTAPDEVEEGQPFEVVAKIRLKDGQVVFDAINGMDLTTEAAPEPEEEVEVEETETVEEEEPMGLMDAARQSGY